MITLIGNLKGGTGKSTVTFNLALWVATRHNKHVIVYDLDPQATTSDAFEIRADEGYLPAIVPVRTAETLGTEGKNSEVLVDMGLADMAALEIAVRKADRILIPIAPSQADVWSTQRFLKMVSDIRGDQAVELLGVINRADTHHAVRETAEAAEAMQMLGNIRLLEPRLYMRTTYRRSFSEGLAVFEMEPRSKAAAEVEELGRLLYPV
ncbi:AAA family ATPase [Thiothrix unzii]|jgi:chromosome partitioning protein|uniref:AAA family ATPase n=2 Tax=Thiothrix TaxID=1030 RepID=A0A975F8V9_9GAMM|nr:AAA family ATPase [Thiothrix unzii]MDX9989941.1 AAA family ATPase [Thiothrix unzii]OQX09263.1 MAG: chromosome partitioning protein [Thiothrix lacustris]QTR53560.1 AAA family ATPase [Thiothrix unzii]